MYPFYGSRSSGLFFLMGSSGTSLSIRLKGEYRGDSCHEDVQGGADVDGDRRASLSNGQQHNFKVNSGYTHVCNCRNNRAQDTHNTIPSNRNTIACTSMRTGQDLGCISIQSAVVHIQTEVNDAGKCNLQHGQYFPPFSRIGNSHSASPS
jgi:hypothetical protein